MTLDAILGPAAPVTVLPPLTVGHRETDHRVSNSLQLISSLLSVQAKQTEDASVREALHAAIHRIGAVGALHKQLCRSEQSCSVNIASYLFDLVGMIEQSFGGGIGEKRVGAQIQGRLVSPKFAGTLGILATELVINACKHAYAPDEAGDIELSLFFPSKSEFRMEVRDYGEKVGDGVSINSAGLGMSIVEAMCRRLNASNERLVDGPGTCVLIRGIVI